MFVQEETISIFDSFLTGDDRDDLFRLSKSDVNMFGMAHSLPYTSA